MSDLGCPRGHVWVTYPNATVSVCQNCGATQPAGELAYSDPLRVPEFPDGFGDLPPHLEGMANDYLARISDLETDILRLRCLLAEGVAYAQGNRPLDAWIRSASAYLQKLITT